MQLSELKDKKIGILGFGVEGQEVAKFLSANGIAFDILDRNAALDIGAFQPARTFLGADYLGHLGGYQILFRSPGIKFFPEIVAARQGGTVVTSQMKYFFDNCRAKIVGVTGTKGKGTTAKLIFDILQAARIKSFLAGNIGTGVLNLLDQAGPEDYVVLELSSFQLEDLEKSPQLAVVLMITSEHLDYHADQAEYIAAKAAITKYQSAQDAAVINYDYENSRAIGALGQGRKYYFHTAADSVAAGSAEIKDGMSADKDSGEISFVAAGVRQHFLNGSELFIPGYHNVQNVCAASLTAKIIGVNEEVIAGTVRNFRGLEHRLEFVIEKNGIKFYNDSFGSTIDTCIAAVQSFTQPEIVIVGGFDKKGDYAQLAKDLSVQKNIKTVIVIGDIGPRLKKHLLENHFSGQLLDGAKNIQQVFEQVRQTAVSGDLVLLAPATSSFDWFKNYKDRGAQFKKLALEF